MRKSTYSRMIKKVYEINNGPLSKQIIIKKPKELELQSSYNPLLNEYTETGVPEFEIIDTANAIFSAFKESEKWIEIGTLSIHDWKCNINDYVKIDNSCIVEIVETGEQFEVIFIRPYIGEKVVGLRPVIR